jgi:hypothetical protein
MSGKKQSTTIAYKPPKKTNDTSIPWNKPKRAKKKYKRKKKSRYI